MIHGKILIKLILILTFIAFCNKTFALSASAQIAIETIRTKLKQTNTTTILREQGCYVPGTLLRRAMIRLRSKLYNIPVSIKCNKPVAFKRKQSSRLTYIPGQELAIKLKLIVKIIGKNLNIKKSNKIFPKITDLKKSLRIDAKNDKKKIEQYIKESRLTPFVNTLKEYHRLSHTKNKIRRTSIKNNLPCSTHRKQKIFKSLKNDQIRATTINTANEQEIKRFNETIQNQEFKMPRNYRIIVR